MTGTMRSLPLFHRIAGQPVMVLGESEGAEPKRRLVERAGGQVVTSLEMGLDLGARLAFIACDDEAECEKTMHRLRAAGVLVNVVDKPNWCDFTTPSILERDPVLIAVATSGASAGLAKQLRLRLERVIPQGLGELAKALAARRDAFRERWPHADDRRRALDTALDQGGALDLFADGSADRVADWLASGEIDTSAREVTLEIGSDDPEELTLRQARLLGTADVIRYDAAIVPEILARARADARREPISGHRDSSAGLVVILRRV